MSLSRDFLFQQTTFCGFHLFQALPILHLTACVGDFKRVSGSHPCSVVGNIGITSLRKFVVCSLFVLLILCMCYSKVPPIRGSTYKGVVSYILGGPPIRGFVCRICGAAGEILKIVFARDTVQYSTCTLYIHSIYVL